MAIIKYPDWLPLAQRASKNLTQQTPFRSDQPAVGAPIFQKLTTDIAATWSLTWKFTLAEERAFIQWLRSPSYLNKCNNWFTMMIDLGGSGLQEQTLHFTDYPVQTSIDGGVVTWTGNVIAKKLNNTMNEFDDVLVELDYRWYSWLDEVVNRELPQVYMTPILHMPINILSSTLDSRIVYNGPQVYYINRNGNLVQSAADEWPLTFIDGVAVGRVPPENTSKNAILHNTDMTDAAWGATRMTMTAAQQAGMLARSCFKLTPTTDSGSHFIRQDPELEIHDGESHTFSVIAKADGYSYLRLRMSDGGLFISDVTADLINGVLAGGVANSSIENIGGGWFRISERITAPESGYGNISMQLWVHDNSNSSTFSGDGTSGVFVCTPQSDSAGVPTSPIITYSSAVTRQAESAKVVMNGATSIDITYSDGSVVNVQAVGDYATIPQADSAWGSKYITTIKFNV